MTKPSDFPLLFLILTAALQGPKNVRGQSSQEFDWRQDWAVEEGFNLSIDSDGFYLPTALAFVPNPGPDPKDPLYFVTELRGKVKVVTNDRTVYIFTENFFPFSLKPEEELASTILQVGICGIALEPKRGYVFITFAYQDSNKVLRNNIVRFQTQPGIFSIKPSSQVEFTDVFRSYGSGIHHQIGPCQIKDDLLYVGVGDAYQPFQAQNVHSLLGKVLRMTLDGKPVRNNPFYLNENVEEGANYVWAYGFRNPFSLKVVEGRVFVADNGNDTDRFLEIQKGRNYLWNGHNWSISANAAFVFVPSVGPVQLDYNPRDSALFSGYYEGNFFLATSATQKEKVAGIVILDYDIEENRMLSIPKYLLRFTGPGDEQSVAALAFGHDGLYFAPLLPNRMGRTFVLKVTYQPEKRYPTVLAQYEDAYSLVSHSGCFGCHIFPGFRDEDINAGSIGPPLGVGLEERILARLDSKEYEESVREFASLDQEPFRSFKAEREEVMSAEQADKVRIWMKYHLMDPRFDNRYSRMPTFGFSEEEATLITDYLLAKSSRIEDLRIKFARFLPSLPLRYRHLIQFFVGGFAAALVFFALLLTIKIYFSRRTVRKYQNNKTSLNAPNTSG